jgi:hypothetical protein
MTNRSPPNSFRSSVAYVAATQPVARWSNFNKRYLLPVCIKKVATLQKFGMAQFAVWLCYAGSIVPHRRRSVDGGSHLSRPALRLTSALFSIASEAFSNFLLMLSALLPVHYFQRDA